MTKPVRPRVSRQSDERSAADLAAVWPGDGDAGALRGEILQYVSGGGGCVGWLVESAFVKIGLTGSDMAKG